MELKMAGMALVAVIAATGFFMPGSIISKGKTKRYLKLIKQKQRLTFPVEQSIEVNLPAFAAYQHWKKFEDFPKFLSGVERVKQIDQSRLQWVGSIGGVSTEWETEITQLVNGERIGWCSVGEIKCAGVITFCPVTNTTTWVTVQMEYPDEDNGLSWKDTFKLNSKRLSNDLKKYKAYIENQGLAAQSVPKSKLRLCAVNA
jgi:uncharacterized membrane protein